MESKRFHRYLTYTWKGIQAIVFLQTRSVFREPRSHSREREELAIPCIYTRNIVRCFPLYWIRVDVEGREGRDAKHEMWKSWKRREKCTGNTTERPSSKQVCFRINICSIHDGTPLWMHPSSHRRARTHACLLLSARLSPLLCDTTASGCHVSPRGLVRGRNRVVSRVPKVGFRLCSIILARQISRCLLLLSLVAAR